MWAGGWTRDALPRPGWAIIDLTGDKVPSKSKVAALNPGGKAAFTATLQEMKKTKFGPWLSFPIKDFGVPEWDKEVWQALAVDVARMMLKGTDVLIACTGGHGRTGMAVTILAGILRPDLIGTSPIKWLRDIYCDEVVETKDQVSYVFGVLGLPEDGTKPADKPYSSSYAGGSYYDSESKAWVEKDWSKVGPGEFKPGRKYNTPTGKWDDDPEGRGRRWDGISQQWLEVAQPTGSSVGPTKEDSPKVVAPHSPGSGEGRLPTGTLVSTEKPAQLLLPRSPGGNGDEEETELSPRESAVIRLGKSYAGVGEESKSATYWEDDQGRVVDQETGERFDWVTIELMSDLLLSQEFDDVGDRALALIALGSEEKQ